MSKCKGLFFRYRNYGFRWNWSRVRFSKSEEFQFLSDKSCKGCPECEGFFTFVGTEKQIVEFPSMMYHGDIFILVKIRRNFWAFEWVKE